MRLIDADHLWDFFREKQSEITEYAKYYQLNDEDKAAYDRIETVLDAIDSAPTIDPSILDERFCAGRAFMSKGDYTCKDCLYYPGCLVHCSELVLKNRGICEHFLDPSSLVKRGRWINEDFPEKTPVTQTDMAMCSECRRLAIKVEHGYSYMTKFCPFCGALMED